MPPTPPGEQDQPNRFASIAELEPGQEVWAYARGYWRKARVVTKARKTARVGFRLSTSDLIRVQALQLGELRRTDPGNRYFQPIPAPTAAELGL